MSVLSAIIVNHTVSDKKQLQMILSNEPKFELFILWMYREFSHETILSFIELVQYKLFCIEIVKQKHNEQLECQYKFYENMPKSSIVYAMEKANKYEFMAQKLYAKYIQEFSEFEVNISGLLRDKYQRLDENNWNLEIKEMVTVFDEVIDEMYYLMIQSFARFKSESRLSITTPTKSQKMNYYWKYRN